MSLTPELKIVAVVSGLGARYQSQISNLKAPWTLRPGVFLLPSQLYATISPATTTSYVKGKPPTQNSWLCFLQPDCSHTHLMMHVTSGWCSESTGSVLSLE